MKTTTEKNLDLLGTFHTVFGIIGVLMGLAPLLQITISILTLSGMLNLAEAFEVELPEWFGYSFLILGIASFVISQTTACLILYSGRQLKKRRKRRLSFVVACGLCLAFPLGTILGIFTLIILNQDETKELYQQVKADRNQPRSPLKLSFHQRIPNKKK